MGPIDWHFCVIGFESPTLGNPQLDRTLIFDGARLRRLSEFRRPGASQMFVVEGADGFMAEIERANPRGPCIAAASIIIVEAVDGKHAAALAFQQSHVTFSNPTNMCFHADPFFGSLGAAGDERACHGRLYLIDGSAEDAFERYRKDFPARSRTTPGTTSGMS
jgi:hypothetical protein